MEKPIDHKDENRRPENKSKERESTLGRAVGDMAHYIKNILNGLEGGVYMVNTGLKRERQELLTRGWNMVEKNVIQISDLALNMIIYSKGWKPEPELCSPNDIAEEALDILKGKARSAGVTLEKELISDVNECLLDKKGVQRCLLNVAAYAIDACSADGPKEGGCRVTIRGCNDIENITFDIAANNPDLERGREGDPFEVFLETTGSEGTGFGLLVAHDIALSNGGSITIKKHKKGGTGFSLRFPLIQPDGSSSIKKSI